MVEFFGFIFVWTVVSVVWFIRNLGRKYDPDPWYAYIIAPPGLVIAWIIGVVTHRKEIWCQYFKGHDFVQHPQNEQIFTCSKCKKVERRL